MSWASLFPAAYGLLAILAQALLLRELGALTRGNEAVIGILLFAWLTGNGLGSALFQFLPGRVRSRPELASFLLFSSAVLLTATVFLARFVQGLLLYESAPNLIWVSAVSFFLIMPVSIPAGMAFSRLAMDRRRSSALAGVYLLESGGAFLGGMLFAFWLAGRLDMLRAAALLAAAFGLIHLVNHRSLSVGSAAVAVLAGLAGSVAFKEDAARFSRLLQFRGTELVSVMQSRLADVVLTKTRGLRSAYYGGRMLYSEDARAWEEASLLPAIVKGRPRRVLVAGFPAPPFADRLARLSLESVHAVFPDRALAGLLEERIAAGKLTVEVADPFRWSRRPRGNFDLILVAAELPRAISDNRYFSETFYRRLGTMLAEGGMLSLSVPYEDPLPSPSTLAGLKIVRATLSACFAHVDFLAAEEFHFFASSKEISLGREDVLRRLGNLGARGSLVNAGYVRHYFAADRREGFRRMLAGDAAPNGLFSMGLYRAGLRQWLRADLGEKWLLALVAAVLGLGLASWMSRKLAADRHSVFLCAAGFCLMAGEIELLNFHQGASGLVFRSYAVLASLFMLGSAVGAGLTLAGRRGAGLREGFTVLALVWTGIVAILYLLPPARAAAAGESLFLIGGLNVLGGIGAGGIFGVEAARIAAKRRETARACAQLYSFDLFGAAAAALIAPLVLAPVLGHSYTAALGLGVLLTAAAATRKGRYGP